MNRQAVFHALADSVIWAGILLAAFCLWLGGLASC
jgi:hypothetical protein